MVKWQIKSNHLIFKVNSNKNFLDLLEDYLYHRFRSLFAEADKYLIPIFWSYNNGVLDLEFDVLPEEFQQNSDDIKDYLSHLTWEKSGFIKAIRTFARDHKLFPNFFQFFPKNGKWIPPVSYFLSTFYEKQESDCNDVKFCEKWVNGCLEVFIKDMDKETKRLLENIIKALNHNKIVEIIEYVKNERIVEKSSFLDFLTESEFFSKIREIYRFQTVLPEDAQFRHQIQKDEQVLEINLYYKDPHFGKIKRPSVQELWDNLMSTSRTARLMVFSDLRKLPNPLIIIKNSDHFIEWINVHKDQQQIIVKKGNRYIPKSGYIYVYEYGDIDQIQKKRFFIKFAKNHPLLINYINSISNYETLDFKNKWNREDLVNIIIKNRGLFLVQGPPGTGKTFLATEVVADFLQTHPHGKILVCSKEHLALDYILTKVVEKLNEKLIPYRAYRSLSHRRATQSFINPQIKDFLSTGVMKEIGTYNWDENSKIWYHAQESLFQEYDLRNLSLSINSASIIFCTTMDSLFYQLINKVSFDLIVVEEAGKCYPSELLHTLCLGQNVLLIGDQNQLPPYQIKETEEALEIWENCLSKAEKDIRLNERLEERFGISYKNLKSYYRKDTAFDMDKLFWLKPFETLFNLLPDEKKHVLEDQYRMEPELSKVIGNVFYNRTFRNRKKKSFPLKDVIPQKYDVPLLWIDIPHMIEDMEASEDPEKIGMRVNFYELNVLKSYLNKFNFIKKIDMVILTPYNDQKDLFLESKELKEFCKKLSDKSFEEIIKTTDEYQGHEADLTILSLVRNNSLASKSAWGFITESERLNVMFSRTRSRQVVIGCSKHIIRNKFEERIEIFYKLYLEYQKDGIFISSYDVLENSPNKTK